MSRFFAVFTGSTLGLQYPQAAYLTGDPGVLASTGKESSSLLFSVKVLALRVQST